MQIYRNEQIISQKMNSSIKKSGNKISLYSKRLGPTKSPKRAQVKSQQNLINLQPYQFPTKNHIPTQFLQQVLKTPQTKLIKHQIDFDQKYIDVRLKKINTTGPTYNFQYMGQYSQQQRQHFQINRQYRDVQNRNIQNIQYQINRMSNNSNNISDMIEKEVQSQINNASVLETSFQTGQAGNKPIKLSQISNQQVISKKCLQNFMKTINQQLWIAKQNYTAKITILLKQTAKTTQQLTQKLLSNQLLLKQKTKEIQQLRKIVHQSQTKNIGTIKVIQFQTKSTDKDKSQYVQRRLQDLDAKLKVLVDNQILKKNKLNNKTESLEKLIVSMCGFKINNLTKSLQSFVQINSKKLAQIQKNYSQFNSKQSSELTCVKQSLQWQKRHHSSLTCKQNHLSNQITALLTHEFKYQNTLTTQLMKIFQQIKQQIRSLQIIQFQMKKNIKTTKEMIIKEQIGKEQTNYKHTHYQDIAFSKFTINNPNVSTISIGTFSNTNENSNLLEKINVRNHNQSDINDNQSDIISMNFLQDNQLNSSHNQLDSGHHNQEYIFRNNNQPITMSKYSKITSDMRQTNLPLSKVQQNSPYTNKAYYLPLSKGKQMFTLSQNQLNSIKTTQIQQKLRNLDQLKMISNQQGKTPTKKSINLISNQKNNNSYWSISQMEDFNVDGQVFYHNQTQDFADDEFFYFQNNDQQYNLTKISPKRLTYQQQITSHRSQLQDFSPKQVKLNSTQQNFHRISSPLKFNKTHQNFLYNSNNFDYENFSDEQQELPKSSKNIHTLQTPLKYSINQRIFLEQTKFMNQKEFPLDVNYDQNTRQGVIKVTSRNSITVKLSKHQLNNLVQMGKLNLITK